MKEASNRRRKECPSLRERREGLKRIVERGVPYAGCAQGIDHRACVRTPGEAGEPHQEEEVREFSATTRGLLQLRDWLVSFGVTLVGMEATGVYWKAALSTTCSIDDFECWLVNARHLKNVPGRKTDVKDAEWRSCRLVEHGVLRPSFVPPKER
jgi:transposase